MEIEMFGRVLSSFFFLYVTVELKVGLRGGYAVVKLSSSM
jgi:hypothetical protein